MTRNTTTRSARLLEPPRQSQAATGERGYFEIGLYEVEFEFELRDAGRVLWLARFDLFPEPVPNHREEF